jgi:hypothetical protein
LATRKPKTVEELAERKLDATFFVMSPDMQHKQFAAAALGGLIARGGGMSIDAIVVSAFNYADAMMEAIKK